ncbi:glycoside hydrolase family 76 protein [Glutamicibacter sp. Je.9.36]|uniref:glycoside hydrolase family 76 protein n=1 Tax=Glutamicibacter sp. Je.9.36 TaxID=3142837 RepID=UPI003DA86E04
MKLESEGTMESMQELAHQAAIDTHQRFGHRLMGLPGTWIGQSYSKAHRLRDGSMLSNLNGFAHPLAEWNYWWQAHYLDAIIDEGRSYWDEGNEHRAREALARANGLLRGIRIRNFGILPNYFFDDMAWLALACGRLSEFTQLAMGHRSRPAEAAVRTLGRQLHAGMDGVLDGGLYWSRKRDFKNTPANAPAALFFARTGEKETARELLQWLEKNLFSVERGLYLDGLRLTTQGHTVEPAVYTYNQGLVLGALLELGEPADLAHAQVLIDATTKSLSTAAGVLSFNSGGDGNLFAGILCRYLALAGNDVRLEARSREQARRLVMATARHLADQEPRRLSAAIQRWMIFSAAAQFELNAGQ